MSPGRPDYPASPARPVIDTLHGREIVDPWRWLEDSDAAEVGAWTAAQNALTRDWLEQVPERDAIRRRLEELLAIGGVSTPSPLRGKYLYEQREGKQNQPVLYLRDGRDGPARVLLDPNSLSAEGTTALDWYHPSEDGRRLAYGLSEDGSEESILAIMDLDTGEVLPDRIERTRAADVAWLPDHEGFYYTRYPEPGSVPEGEAGYHRAIWFHRVGDDPGEDKLVFRPEEKEHWPAVGLSPDGRWLTVVVARTFDQTDLYLKDLYGVDEWITVAKDLPASFEGRIVRGRLYLRTNLDAPSYRLFTVDPLDPRRESWREIVPERPDAVLDGALVLRDRLALHYVERASSRLVLTGLDGGNPVPVELPAIGSVFGLGGEWDGTELLVGFSSYTWPPTVFRLDLLSGERTVWHQVDAGMDPERFTVQQVSCPGRDGTNISMFLVHEGRLSDDRPRRTYLTGYGGFNISMTPAFSRSMMLWLERGGLLAVPNLRGGGEYGEAWHQGGMLASKQNTFDDFIAAAEFLIRQGWTDRDHLVIAGGSNGGLLTGAALTQRPDLFRGVIIQVPLLDMLRYHRFLIARLWIPEYGSPDDPEQFEWLAAYSPYHHVREGLRYPAVFLATAESDTRVHPMHARKMAARLQHATSSDAPVLLRLETRAGHGAGKPVAKLVEELTDMWSFVFGVLPPDGVGGEG